RCLAPPSFVNPRTAQTGRNETMPAELYPVVLPWAHAPADRPPGYWEHLPRGRVRWPWAGQRPAACVRLDHVTPEVACQGLCDVAGHKRGQAVVLVKPDVPPARFPEGIEELLRGEGAVLLQRIDDGFADTAQGV